MSNNFPFGESVLSENGEGEFEKEFSSTSTEEEVEIESMLSERTKGEFDAEKRRWQLQKSSSSESLDTFFGKKIKPQVKQKMDPKTRQILKQSQSKRVITETKERMKRKSKKVDLDAKPKHSALKRDKGESYLLARQRSLTVDDITSLFSEGNDFILNNCAHCEDEEEHEEAGEDNRKVSISKRAISFAEIDIILGTDGKVEASPVCLRQTETRTESPKSSKKKNKVKLKKTQKKLLEGHMQRKAGLFKKWQNFWVVLRPTGLWFYRRPSKSTIKTPSRNVGKNMQLLSLTLRKEGIIHFKEVEWIRKGQGEHELRVQTTNKTSPIQLLCPCEEVRDDWLSQIELAYRKSLVSKTVKHSRHQSV